MARFCYLIKNLFSLNKNATKVNTQMRFTELAFYFQTNFTFLEQNRDEL